MRNFNDELPVLWHQCLLSFVEQYKSDISSEQREALLELMKVFCFVSVNNLNYKKHFRFMDIIKLHLRFNATYD